MTEDEFLAKAKKVWGERFDYSLTRYKGCRDKIVIICPEHGRYRQIAANHLDGRDCFKCARVRSEKYMFG